MRILSGIQPSGRPHIGNYFGMMKPAIDLQREGEAFLFIADYHALTTSPDPAALRERTFNLALDFLACGLDPEKTVFFRQSDIPEVVELAWIISTVTPVGLLERCHSYKDKLAKGITANAGLFFYPVLMAADILMYHSTIVPVGKDQKQHVEVTRDIAIRFNNTYGELFTIPEPSIREEVAVVPGTDGQKMSKSYHNTIELFGSEKETRKTIMSVLTDSKGLEDVKDPATCNVAMLYKLFASSDQMVALEEKYRAGNYGYGHAKQELFSIFWEYMAPFRAKRAALAANPDYVESVLRSGAERARMTASKLMDDVKRAVGLR